MNKGLDEKFSELGPQRRRKVEARAAALIAEEECLRELRRAHRLTQKRMADAIQRLTANGARGLESSAWTATGRATLSNMRGRRSMWPTWIR